MNNPISYIEQASRIVFAFRGYLVLSIISFGVFLAFYAFLLPATYTGGRIGMVSLRFISIKLALFAFIFSFLLAFIIPFAAYAFRKRQEKQKSSSVVGSFFGSVLPPLLCCSPILPSVAAFAGGVLPFAPGVSGFIQGSMATYETQIFTAIVAILVYSLYQNSKQVAYAAQGICN